MADTFKGSGRCQARALIRETTNTTGFPEGNSRAVAAYIGTNYVRDTFTGVTSATVLNGRAPEEGPTGATWRMAGHLTGDSADGGRILSSAINSTGSMYVDGGSSSGFLSISIIWSAVATTDFQPCGTFRGNDFHHTHTSWRGYFFRGEDTGGGNAKLSLQSKGSDGVMKTIAWSQSLPLPAAGTHWQIECAFHGAGTVADPTTIEVWINGTQVSWLKTPDAPLGATGGTIYREYGTDVEARATNTFVGFCTDRTVAGKTSTQNSFDNFFFANVPTNPGACPNHASWHSRIPLAPVRGGDVLPIKIRWVRTLTPTALTVPTPTHVGFVLRKDGSGTSPTAVSAGGDAVRAFDYTAGAVSSGDYGFVSLGGWHATLDGTSTGNPRSGCYRLHVYMKNDTDASGGGETWQITSEPIFFVKPTGTEVDYGRGYFVARTSLAPKIINTAAGLNEQALPYTTTLSGAYPESFTVRLRPEHAPLETRNSDLASGRNRNDPTYWYTQNNEASTPLSGSAAWGNDGAAYADTASDLADSAYNEGSWEGAFGVGLRVESRIMNNTGSTSYNGDPYFVWDNPPTGFRTTVGSVAGINSRTESSSAGTAYTETAFEVNPRLNPSFTRDAATPAVVNFGLHELRGTFTIANARGTLLNATDHSGFVAVEVRSVDLTADPNGVSPQGTLSASLSPTQDSNADGKNDRYVLPTGVTYSGPTTQAARGTGPNGDTAAHTTTGRAKGIRVRATQADGPAGVSTQVWALSDLLKIGVHTQRVGTFNAPADGLAEPDSTEHQTFTIAVDRLYAWGYVTDVNSQPVADVSLGFKTYDAEGIKGSATTNTMKTTGASGWTTQAAGLDVKAPGGTWKVEAYADIIGQQGNSQNTRGNYGDGDTNRTDDALPSGTYTYRGWRENNVSFLSPYTADKLLYIGAGQYLGQGVTSPHGNHAIIGGAIIVGCALSVNDTLTIPDAQGDPNGTFPAKWYAEFALSRFNNATGRAQHFKVTGFDPTTYTITAGEWITDDGTTATKPQFFKIGASQADNRLFVRVISSTVTTTANGWIPGVMFCTSRVIYQGAYFQSQSLQPVVATGDKSGHHNSRKEIEGYAADVAFEQSLVFGW